MFDIGTLILIVPLVVLLIVVGTVVQWLHQSAVRALGGAEDPASAATERLIGRVLSRLLAPIQHALGAVSTLIVLAGLFLIANQLRIWDDGLVDVSAKVTALERRCVPRTAKLDDIAGAQACKVAAAGEKAVDVIGLRFTTADGEVVNTWARKDLVASRETVGITPESTIRVSYRREAPAEITLHLYEWVTLGAGWFVLVGVLLRGAALVIRAIRARLEGRDAAAAAGQATARRNPLRRGHHHEDEDPIEAHLAGQRDLLIEQRRVFGVRKTGPADGITSRS